MPNRDTVPKFAWKDFKKTRKTLSQGSQCPSRNSGPVDLPNTSLERYCCTQLFGDNMSHRDVMAKLVILHAAYMRLSGTF
jgi:hypothetical protein